MSGVEVQAACRVCQNTTDFLWVGKMLGHQVRYYECPHCGYVQTEDPFWLEAAYSQAINMCDTGIMARNVVNARITLMTLLVLGKAKSNVVDYAGGYGILVRMLRDYGVNAFWSDRYCDNLLARGFEYDGGGAGLLTAFEAFEHFVDPVAEMTEMFKLAPNLLLSTEIVSDPTPRQNDWWYYGPDHGQHIGFFRIKTFRQLAKDFGKHFYSDGRSYHLFLDHPIPAVYWRLALRFARFAPIFARVMLTSKTWGDHVLLSGGGK
jgi:hypothetical protein